MAFCLQFMCMLEGKHFSPIGLLCCLTTNAPTQTYLVQDPEEHTNAREGNVGIR